MATFDRKNTLEFLFDRSGAKPGPFEIHQWLKERIGLLEDQVEAIQLDGIKSTVYVKFINDLYPDRVIHKHGRDVDFKLDSGQVIKVKILKSDEQEKKIRVFNLPLELPNKYIQDYFTNYGHVTSIIDEKWGGKFAFSVKNGVRMLIVNLIKPVPSFVEIQGFKAHVVYEGQDKTCSVCHSNQHLRSECPRTRAAAQRLKVILADTSSQDELHMTKLQSAAAAPAAAEPASEEDTHDTQTVSYNSDCDVESQDLVPETQTLVETDSHTSTSQDIIEESQPPPEQPLPPRTRKRSITKSTVKPYVTRKRSKSKKSPPANDKHETTNEQ